MAIVKKRDLYHGRYYRTGGSYAIAIPPDVREMMGFLPGEHVVMNVSHGILWVTRLTTQVVFPREKIAQIFDQIFAEKKPAHEQHE